jgi:hypothetical protein
MVMEMEMVCYYERFDSVGSDGGGKDGDVGDGDGSDSGL